MGAAGGSLVAEALRELRAEVLQYLGQRDTYGPKGMEMLAQEGSPIPLPPLYALYLDVRQEGQPLVDGGYFDQPFLMSLCMAACRSAERQHEHVQRRNEELRLQAELEKERKQAQNVIPFPER